MSEPRWTRGPWLVSEENLDEEVEIINQYRINNSLVEIATVKLGYDGDLGEEQNANARLIAAAPDLYEALVAVLCDGMLGAHMAHWDKTGGSGSGCPACEANRKVASIARTALARARGEP